MAEGIVELPVQIAPESFLKRLTDLGARRQRLRKYGLRIVHVERQHYGCAADRGRCEHAHFRELVREMERAVSDSQLNRHQPPVGRGNPAQLLGAEGVAIERRGAFGVLNHDVGRDLHGPTVVQRGSARLERSCPCSLVEVETERVRIWRPPGEERVLLMAGRTTGYAVEPRGEYIFGVVAGKPMRARRGREHHLVAPGELVAWDPSDRHAGHAVDAQPWSARLLVVEVADLAELASDEESDLPPGVLFPEPVIRDPELARAFLQMHIALERPTSRLEREERLSTWLRAVIERFSAARPMRLTTANARDDRAFRSACEYLADQPERNIGLDELAAAAGIGKFRLVRLIRDRAGLPPHALQLAHRVRAARRLLEAGESIAAAAAATGFADQSHLHRHFERTLGLTPGAYQRLTFGTPTDASRA
jgi:AraC-like DNA-binding protein